MSLAADAPEELSVPTETLGPILSYPDNRTVNLALSRDYREGDHVTAAAGLSLACCEGDPTAANILFVTDCALDAFVATHCENTGDFAQTTALPVTLGHIFWCFALRVTNVKDHKHVISLVNIGTHIGFNAPKKYAVSTNEIQNLGKPRVLGCQLIFKDKSEEKETVDLVPDVKGLKVAKMYTIEELKELTYGNKVMSFRVKLIIPRSYFQLSSIISLDNAPAITAKSQAILDTILRGERPPGYDWAITVSESDTPGPTLYYVHKAAFASMSMAFKTALSTGRSLDDRILMVTGENRCILPQLTAHEMKVLIPLVYGFLAPLPQRWQRVAALGAAATKIIDAHLFTSVIFPQWERAVVQQAIALDKHAEASFSVILSLLMIIWSTPFGKMPIAKRVAVGVMADMIHLQYGENDNKWKEFIVSKKALRVFVETWHFEGIISSVCKHLHFVSRVQKIGLTEQQVEWK